MRILITGSREFTDWQMLVDAINSFWCAHCDGPLTLVHGACPTGADALAHEFALRYSDTVIEERHPARWSEGRSAGLKRNMEMVALGADHCLAFYKDGAGNRGTHHCATAAFAANIPVHKYVAGDAHTVGTVE